MQRQFENKLLELSGHCRDGSATEAPALLLAVSGGVDSMCMAQLSLALSDSLRLAVAHCNFHLRSDESDGDEALVRRWASDHGIAFHVNHFDTEAYARERGVSIEMAARELRYTWFAGLCADHGYDAVCVAHNADDNAETLMLNLLRGSGMSGLSGMSEISSLPYSDGRYLLLRPLLTFTRKQIEGYAFAERLEYRTDSTNALSDYKRNRIRNEVFPIFRKMNPSVVRTLNRDMAYFSEAGGIVEDYCRALVPSIVTEYASGPLLRIDLDALMADVHWRYLLYHILKPYGFNQLTLGSIEALLLSDRTVSGKRFHAPGYVLVAGRDELLLLPSEESEDEVFMTVRTVGNYFFRGRTYSVEQIPYDREMPLRQPEGVLILDADRLSFPFVMRAWKEGDWLVPFGMKGKKKVSDLFTDLKYDALQKESAVMIVDVAAEGMAESRHVAAVAGVRIDDRYKVTSVTSRIIRITVLTEC